ncbi:unnamed protein product, partial [Brenthis ino]
MKYSCCKSTSGGATDRITCIQCKCHYHIQCLFPSNEDNEISNELKKKWTCPTCSCTRRGLNTDNTPVRSSPLGSRSVKNTNINMQRGGSAINQSPETMDIGREFNFTIDDIKHIISSEIAKWKSDLELTINNLVSSFLQPIKEDIVNLKDSISFINTKYEEINQKIAHFENEIKVLSAQSSSLNDLRINLDSMEAENNKREQWVRRSNVEIYGIPEKKNENLMELLQSISSHIGYQVNPATDIDFITRVAPTSRENRRSKPIIIRFLSRWKKDDFLSIARKNKLKCSDLGFSGNNSNIYFNDHLTKSNKNLLQEAKKLAKEKSFLYVWVKNCTIMVRRSDTSPVLHIINQSDLKKIA